MTNFNPRPSRGIADHRRNAARLNAQKQHRKSKLFGALAAIAAGGALAILAIVLILINIVFVVLAVFMLVWNITDIQNVGPNFWNVTWIVIASLILLSVLRNTLSGGSN